MGGIAGYLAGLTENYQRIRTEREAIVYAGVLRVLVVQGAAWYCGKSNGGSSKLLKYMTKSDIPRD